MPVVTNTEWLNTNSLRNYPIKEDLDRTEPSPTVPPALIIPNDFLVDLRLTGTKSFFDEPPSVMYPQGRRLNVDYFILSIVSDGVQDPLTINIREIVRETYSPGDPATFVDHGFFSIDPSAHSKYDAYVFEQLAAVEEKINGHLVVGNIPDIPKGTYLFEPDNTTLEARTLIPASQRQEVTSLAKEGDPNLIRDDVLFLETSRVAIDMDPEERIITFEFVSPDLTIECDACGDPICSQPALMKLKNVPPPARRGNINVIGRKGIKVSGFPILRSGGSPANPNDYDLNGIVLSYNGPLLGTHTGGDPSVLSNWTVGLDCCAMPCHDKTDILSQLDFAESALSIP